MAFLIGVFFNLLLFIIFLYQWKMFKINNDVKQEHSFASKPIHWPLMLKGVAYWLDKTTNVSLLTFFTPFLEIDP